MKISNIYRGGVRGLFFEIYEFAHRYSRNRLVTRTEKHYFDMLREHNIPVRRLNKKQIKEVEKLWGKGVSVKTHELVYSVTGKYDPRICPERLFRTIIELKLNRQSHVLAWNDKNYYERFFPTVRFPKTYIHNIDGHFLDADYQHITKEQAIEILMSKDIFIIKPSLDSGFGNNVEKINPTDRSLIEGLLERFDRDYVCQEAIIQYAALSRLNESSVNVIRYNSLNVNGKVTPINATLRVGAKGCINDISISKDGRGYFCVGVREDGTLKDIGYHSCGENISIAPNGEKFSGIRLPNFDKATAIVQYMHERMPMFGFIGFDIAFGCDGEPIVIEYNLKGPGNLYYQYTNGPTLGDRTEEVAKIFKIR